jgi:hypothetical protein
VFCLSPVTLVVTGTGTGSNTLSVAGPTGAKVATGDDVTLTVAGPTGTYTVTDTDTGGHPGVFWASHGSTCASGRDSTG